MDMHIVDMNGSYKIILHADCLTVAKKQKTALLF